MPAPPDVVVRRGSLVTPRGIISPGYLVSSGGRIVEIGPDVDGAAPRGPEVIDADGAHVIPGLIDLHIHGLLGHDSMGPGLRDVASALPAYGVTAFLATTVTLPRSEALARLQQVSAALRPPPPGARCAGIHLEGPFLSPGRAGMARGEWFEDLSWTDVQAYLDAADGAIRLLTLAPELPGAAECIPRLLGAGIIASAGHSDASFEEMARAVHAGLRHATHTFNAMRPLHHRRPGVVGAVLHFDQIVAELIADGVHVHAAVAGLLLRVKGPTGVCLVSDAAPQAGLPDGVYDWDGQAIHVAAGACRLEDGTISGAHALLDTGLRTLVHKLALPLEAAVLCASTTPAHQLGMNAGRLQPGCLADFVLLDEGLQPIRTFVGGVEVYGPGAGAREHPV
jgi:N-acetylglucosamine-6-phosphate deacetylase